MAAWRLPESGSVKAVVGERDRLRDSPRLCIRSVDSGPFDGGCSLPCCAALR